MKEQPARILVVDDDVDACRNLADILEDVGYEVDTAENGLFALELIQEKPYDVALLDLKMPGMDGLTLYREIRKLRADTVAMIITAYANEETAKEALQAGAWQVMSKPVNVSQLLPLVDEAAGQPLIMIVDDDHALCENLWDLLRERGFRVGIAHSERETGQRLKERDFQVFLIDLKLQDCDGQRIFQLVRGSQPEARTVLITGYRSETSEMVEKILHEGADAVCYKPFDVDELLATVARLSHHTNN